MTSYQAGTAGQGGGILSAPIPELPDGRGPDSDIVPVSAIPVGGPLLLLLDTTVVDNPKDPDQVAIDITRTQPPAVPTPADYTRLPRLRLPNIDVRPVKFPYPVPTEHLGEDATPVGPTTIWVRCVYYESGLNSLTSPFVQFQIDRTAPWQAKPVQTAPNPGQRPGVKSIPAVSFPNAPGDLDDTWAALPGSAMGLRVAINITYPNAQPDDHLRLYAANQRSNPPQVPPFFDAAMPLNGEVVIPTIELRKITSGRIFIWLDITDAAGNTSATSVNFRNTRFSPLPELDDPNVPANADGLVELNDARAGVTVEVNRPVNALNDDVVSLTWGGQPAQDLPFGTLTKLIFSISWLQLSTEYFDNQTGSIYEVPVQVRADLMRNNVSVSDADTSVNTDFSTHPPYDVDPLDPPPVVNPEFQEAIVRGQPPVTDNVLGPHDVNQTAQILIDTAPFSGGVHPDPEPGDLVTAYFRGDAGPVVVGSVPMDATNINTVITIDLPYSIVGPGGLGLKKVRWVYENPNRNNPQTSRETDVTVDTVVINLEPPEFVRPPADGTSDPFIICESLTVLSGDHVARFRIPPNSHFVENMPVTFNWRGFRTADYATPAPVDTEFTQTRPISLPELTAGMIFDVGRYSPVIRNVPVPPPATPDPADFYAGYVKVWYSTPTVPTSAVTEMTVYLLNADFLYCESEPGWDPVS